MAIFNWINGQAGGTPISAENLNQMQLNLLETVFPIGSTYITQTNTNPSSSSILGFGTWERFKGLVALGLDENDTNLNMIGNSGGEKTHILTTDEIPNHAHDYARNVMWAGEHSEGKVLGEALNNANSDWIRCTSHTTGGDQAHNNMQPYEVVGYMWIRRN